MLHTCKFFPSTLNFQENFVDIKCFLKLPFKFIIKLFSSRLPNKTKIVRMETSCCENLVRISSPLNDGHISTAPIMFLFYHLNPLIKITKGNLQKTLISHDLPQCSRRIRPFAYSGSVRDLSTGCGQMSV